MPMLPYARRLGASAVLIALVGLSGHARSQDCAPRPLVSALLTPLSTPLPRDGAGLVAGLRLGDAGEAARPTFDGLTLTRRRSTEVLTAVEIAPGLVRLAPAASLAAGAWTLHGLGPDTELTVGRAPLPGAPVRPSVRTLRRVAATSTSAGATPRVEVRALLEFPVPPGVVALLVYWNGESSPSSWARAVLSSSEMVVYTEPNGCDPVPTGTRSPTLDGSAPLTGAIAFVDPYGRISPASAPVTVE